jgi:nitrogen regulatory protein PII
MLCNGCGTDANCGTEVATWMMFKSILSTRSTPMILVVAIIRPEKLGAVQKALSNCGVDQITVTKVLGGGHEKGHAFIYRSTTIEETLHSRIKLEIAVDRDAVDSVICAIQQSAKTGRVGDGLIWLIPLAQAVRIRTGVATNWALDEDPLSEPIVAGGRLTPSGQSRPYVPRSN